MKKYVLADFCAGSGGFSLGFEQTKRFKTLFSNDFDTSSKVIYDINFSTNQYCSNIHYIDLDIIPHIDVLSAGFPCQPFSISGSRQGFADDRSHVFYTLMDIVSAKTPRVVVFENVKHLLHHNHGKTFEIIKKTITTQNYNLSYQILNTSKHANICQNRERLYMIAFKYTFDQERFSFPSTIPLTTHIHDFLSKSVDKKYYYSDRFKIWNQICHSIVNEDIIYQYRRGYVRENRSGVCPTLVATMGTGGHNVPLIKDPYGIRKLTPRECFRFQGFPDSYILPSTLSDSKLYKLAGNAITVPIVKTIAQTLSNIFDKHV